MDIDIEWVIGGMCYNKFQTEIKASNGWVVQNPIYQNKLWVSVFWKI